MAYDNAWFFFDLHRSEDDLIEMNRTVNTDAIN